MRLPALEREKVLRKTNSALRLCARSEVLVRMDNQLQVRVGVIGGYIERRGISARGRVDEPRARGEGKPGEHAHKCRLTSAGSQVPAHRCGLA